MFNVYVGKSGGGEEGKERKRKSMLQVGGGGKAIRDGREKYVARR